jgi:hypothetical protein
MRRHSEGMEVKLQASLRWVLDDGVSSASRWKHFYPRGKSFAAWNKSIFLHSVTEHFTEWATPASCDVTPLIKEWISLHQWPCDSSDLLLRGLVTLIIDWKLVEMYLCIQKQSVDVRAKWMPFCEARVLQASSWGASVRITYPAVLAESHPALNSI